MISRTSWSIVFLWLVVAGAAPAQGLLKPWPHEHAIDIFQVHSDFPIPVEAELGEVLQYLRSDISSVLRLPEQTSVVHVVLFRDVKEYGRYMQHYFPSVVQRRAIFLQDRGPGMLFTYWHPELATDLRHEAAHAILNQAGIELPLWLDEGLAEYFEVPRHQRYTGSVYLREVAQRASRGLVPSLLQLEKLTSIAELEQTHYRDSWAWIHFLLHRNQQTRGLLASYIIKARSRSPQPLLSRQLSTISGDLSMEFQQHFGSLVGAETDTAPVQTVGVTGGGVAPEVTKVPSSR
ncbi:MAG: DUF1570 domain-containing protein [Pirellulaceae bacterium]|nr:DUF1570 domain-containing protein [Pirellulaceae bacterium]